MQGTPDASIGLNGASLIIDNEYSAESIDFGALITVSGGSVSSDGLNPRRINLSGLVLIYSERIATFLVKSAAVSSDYLGLLGGSISCKTLNVAVLYLYEFANTITCDTTVSDVLSLYVRSHGGLAPYSLQFNSDLVMQSGSSIVWKDAPQTSVPITIHGQLRVGENVTLSIESPPLVAADILRLPLISLSQPIEGSFASFRAPSGWTVNLTSFGVVLLRAGGTPGETTTESVPVITSTTRTFQTSRPALPLPLPVLIGLGVGGLVVIAGVCLVVFCVCRIRRRRNNHRFLSDEDLADGEKHLLLEGKS